MKKLTLLMILTINFCYSQNLALSLAADFKNAVKATDNKPALNMLAEFSMVSNKGVEVSIEYERFNKINFSRFGFSAGYQLPITEDIKIIPSLSYSLIDRWGENWNRGNNSSHLALGGNVGIRYEISDSFAVELKNQFLNRVDLNIMYDVNIIRYSGFVKLIYKIGL